MSDEYEINWESSELSCGLCGEMLKYADESYVLTVVVAGINSEGTHYAPLLLEDGSDFLYEPYFFCFTCWESCIEDVRLEKGDTPPIVDQYSILECACCESGIRQNEILGIAAFGEVHRSRRSPDTGGYAKFEVMDADPSTLCIECLNSLNAVVDNLWDDGVSQGEECTEGRFIRCWRYGCTYDGTACKALCKSLKETG
jgi:hypothetical protein